MKLIIKKDTITDYLLLTYLIAVTGFPFFYASQVYILIGLLISAYLFLKRKLKIEKSLFILVFPFLIIEILQVLYHGNFEYRTFLGTYVRLFFAYFVVQLLGIRFLLKFFNVIYVFTVISFIFYLPSIFIPGFYEFMADNICILFKPIFAAENSFYQAKPSIIIFTFDKSLLSSFRNSGPFWEPGAYSVFILLAILFKLIESKKLFSKRIIVLIIALASTVSTAGYIAFFILLLGYFLFNVKNYSYKILIVAPLLYCSIYAYNELPFLKKKALENIDLADSTTTSRFGSALADLNDFSKSPWIGWGRGESRYGGKKLLYFSASEHRNNGLTKLLATYGIFIFALYFLLYFKLIRRYCEYWAFNRSFAWVGIFIVLLLGFSQGLFTRPFFYALLFVQFPIIKHIKKSNKQKMQILPPL